MNTEAIKFLIESIDTPSDLTVEIFNVDLQKTMALTIPHKDAAKFMRRLPGVDLARVWNGDVFCTSCSGPFDGWLEQYGGHWDTCPNRVN